MANIRIIKRRIKSAKNISQITKAMEMVAASKMKKAQEKAIAGKPYAQKIIESVSIFAKMIDPKLHPLLKINKTGNTLVILISTNKGLCGGLNSNLFRNLATWFPDREKTDFVTLGKKGEDFIISWGRKLVADFSSVIPLVQAVSSVISLIAGQFLKGKYKKIYVVYNKFVSALSFKPEKKLLLPIQELDLFLKEEEAQEKSKEEEIQEELYSFLIEPSPSQVLNALLPHFLEVILRTGVLEAEASEHSARMLAMKNATDNALELTDSLTLIFNKLRQQAITYEIADQVTARLTTR